MKVEKRLFWLLTLIFFATGCSTYKVASIAPVVMGVDVGEAPEYPPVQIGDQVRITLPDQRIEGQVRGFNIQYITLATTLSESYSRSPKEESDHLENGPGGQEVADGLATIDLEQVIKVERKCGSFGKSLLLLLGIFGVVAGATAAMGLWAVDMSVNMM